MSRLILLLIAVFASPNASYAAKNVKFDQHDGEYRERTEQTLAAQPGGSIVLSSDRGSVAVESWDRSEVKLVVEKRANVFTEREGRAVFKDMEIKVREAEGEISVDIQSASGRDHDALRMSIQISVPRKFNVDVGTEGGSIKFGDREGNIRGRTAGGSVTAGSIVNGSADLETSGGSIKVENITGGSLDASTAGGSIRAGNVSGSVDAETAGGNIRMGKVGRDASLETAGGGIRIDEAGGDLEANTAGGSIKAGRVGGDIEANTAGGSIEIGPAGGSIEAATAGGGITIRGSGGPIKADTAGGSIRITDARGWIEAETAGGSIRASLVISDPNVDTHCTLETSGGNITLYVPEDLAADISADLRIRGNRNKDYQIYSDFPLTIRGDASRRLTAKGKINGGGHPIRLSTTNGNIKILKLDTKDGSQ